MVVSIDGDRQQQPMILLPEFLGGKLLFNLVRFKLVAFRGVRGDN